MTTIPMRPEIFVITATHPRPVRMPYLERMARTFDGVERLTWILVEDGPRDPVVEAFLRARPNIRSRYLPTTRSRDSGITQKNAAFELLAEERAQGVVYIHDDDNYVKPALFSEIRSVESLGLMPVGNLGPEGVERPIVRGGRVVAWSADWTTRAYPIDWAAIAFRAELLRGLDMPFTGRPLHPLGSPPDWFGMGYDEKREFIHENLETETHFVERLVASGARVDFLCEGCRRVLAWHNQTLDQEPDALLLDAD